MTFNSILKIALVAIMFCIAISCEDITNSSPDQTSEWVRDSQNPVLRDPYPIENYESASDGHVFYDDDGNLNMIYSGDSGGNSSIKLARGKSMSDWEVDSAILDQPNSANLDINKETSFYRKSNTGKHQIYYIGYQDSTYKSQIFLAESDNLEGPYTQIPTPVVPRGEIVGKDVYCMTSPSIVEHEGKLYIIFIGWNNSPYEVTEVWVIGAISEDDGHTWSDYRMVDTPIGMEGQLTKLADGSFVAVRTGEYMDKEAIMYGTSKHPFGPWDNHAKPIITPMDDVLEKDEIIAPQITIDQNTGDEYLFYTGVDYLKGWWMMVAKRN